MNKTELVVVVVSVQLELRWGSLQGAQGNRSLKGRIWRGTEEQMWKWKAVAAVAVGLRVVVQVEVEAAVSKGQRWSLRLV